MTVTRVHEGFGGLPSRYDALVDAAATASPFLSRWWFENFIGTVLKGNAKARIYAVESDSGEPLALLPMWVRSDLHRPFGRRCLSSLANFYTPLFGLMMRDSLVTPTVADALCQMLISDSPRWDTIDLRPLAQDREGFTVLKNGLRTAGFMVQPYFCFGNWHLNVGGRSFDQYFREVPSDLRNTIRRKKKRLTSAAESSIQITQGLEGLHRAIADYEAIYSRSWKVPEPYPEFIRGLMHACAVEGYLRLGILYVSGEPAAAQIWIVANGTAAIYKLAYDQRFAHFSVGSILTEELLRHVIDVDKVIDVDYLEGDDAYKRFWMSHRRERWGLLAFNPRSIYGLVSAARHIGGRAVKDAGGALRQKLNRI
jgi:CelD/BcsL family acetyltransferase involved in cellulose biosynthesis